MGVACGAGTHPYTLYSLASIDVAGRSYDILNPETEEPDKQLVSYSERIESSTTEKRYSNLDKKFAI